MSSLCQCRKEALEAWEKDYWAAREAQIKAFQDQQLAELQEQLLKQDSEVSQTLHSTTSRFMGAACAPVTVLHSSEGGQRQHT